MIGMTIDRCDAKSPGGITEEGKLPKKGTQCGLQKGHDGDHCAIIPNGYPWSYKPARKAPTLTQFNLEG